MKPYEALNSTMYHKMRLKEVGAILQAERRRWVDSLYEQVPHMILALVVSIVVYILVVVFATVPSRYAQQTYWWSQQKKWSHSEYGPFPISQLGCAVDHPGLYRVFNTLSIFKDDLAADDSNAASFLLQVIETCSVLGLDADSYAGSADLLGKDLVFNDWGKKVKKEIIYKRLWNQPYNRLKWIYPTEACFVTSRRIDELTEGKNLKDSPLSDLFDFGFCGFAYRNKSRPDLMNLIWEGMDIAPMSVNCTARRISGAVSTGTLASGIVAGPAMAIAPMYAIPFVAVAAVAGATVGAVTGGC